MTLDAQLFGAELKRLGFDFMSGVPCSYLKDLINFAINDCNFIVAANEAEAVAMCAGASLTGSASAVMMQNSGLSNASSALTSLNYTFRIPVLGFVSLRGEPGVTDEPQHELTGRTTEKFLELMEIKWEYLPQTLPEARKLLETAYFEYIQNSLSFFFVVKKNTFSPLELKKIGQTRSLNRVRIPRMKEDRLPSRREAVEKIAAFGDDDTVIIATTGLTGRQLYEAGDRPGNFYMVGSMGCASSIGLGIAVSAPQKSVIVIDGDGAAIMRLGAMATIGHRSPQNMLHILLDNNSHESTGGQSTVSHNADFISIASAVGYRNSIYVHDTAELDRYVRQWKIEWGMTFLYLKTSKGQEENPGRPKIKPPEVASRLKEFIKKI